MKIYRFFGEMNQRNYQARNMMRDEMKMNDLVLFYHSNTKPHPHIAGIAKAFGSKRSGFEHRMISNSALYKLFKII